MSGRRSSNKENVRVCVRVRPPNAKEVATGKTCVTIRGQNTIEVSMDDGNQTFALDQIFGAESSQQSVFDYTSDLIGDVLQGYNATIFACEYDWVLAAPFAIGKYIQRRGLVCKLLEFPPNPYLICLLDTAVLPSTRVDTSTILGTMCTSDGQTGELNCLCAFTCHRSYNPKID
jgi:Microtubule binding